MKLKRIPNGEINDAVAGRNVKYLKLPPHIAVAQAQLDADQDALDKMALSIEDYIKMAKLEVAREIFGEIAEFEISDPVTHKLKGYWFSSQDLQALKQKYGGEK